MYKLIIQDDEGKTTVVPLIRDELSIGREEGNTIRLTERNISRRHATLSRDDKELIFLEDLGSYNGVRVNGSLIEGKVELVESDRVQIGDYLIEVKTDKPNDDAKTREMEALPAGMPVPVPVAISSSEAATSPAILNKAVVESSATSSEIKDEDATQVSAKLRPLVSADTHEEDHAVGRLVILSNSMAGREFDLDKPAMVIGRTEENDIWVNHRSISRHHAKVIRENGTYAVVDLQSANGVRVNGEEYGKVELRRGDVIDLGHVRFRFVAPGEDFVFGRDAQAVKIGEKGKSLNWLWFSLILALVGVVAFLLWNGQKEEPARQNNTGEDPKQNIIAVVEDSTPTEPMQVSDAGIEAVVSIDAAVLDTAVEQTETPDAAIAETNGIAPVSQRAEDAIKNQDWKELATAAKEALAMNPRSQEAKAHRAQAKMEMANQPIASDLQKAIDGRKWANVATFYGRLSPRSTYKEQYRAEHDRLKTEYKNHQIKVARGYAKIGKCSELNRLASKVVKEWADIKRDIRAIKCKVVRVRPDPIPDTSSEIGPSADELVKEAKAAVKATNFGKGFRLCQAALKISPGNQSAIQTCAIASCRLKNGIAAKRFIKKIKSQSTRTGLRRICATNQVPGFEFDE